MIMMMHDLVNYFVYLYFWGVTFMVSEQLDSQDNLKGWGLLC